MDIWVASILAITDNTVVSISVQGFQKKKKLSSLFISLSELGIVFKNWVIFKLFFLITALLSYNLYTI